MASPYGGIAMKPVGIFWDIENCSVPKNKSASGLIHHIRNSFIVNRLNHREYEFLVACDVSKMRKDLPDDMNRAGRNQRQNKQQK
jgi:meiosis arrest female protein 1